MHTTLIAISSLLALAQASPVSGDNVKSSSLSRRDVIGNLGESADPLEITVQPLLDFDSDGCYQTSAIDRNGKVNPGHGPTGTPQGDCRDKRQLDSSNTYSRKRCNNGYCAIMYEVSQLPPIAANYAQSSRTSLAESQIAYFRLVDKLGLSFLL